MTDFKNNPGVLLTFPAYSGCVAPDELQALSTTIWGRVYQLSLPTNELAHLLLMQANSIRINTVLSLCQTIVWLMSGIPVVAILPERPTPDWTRVVLLTITLWRLGSRAPVVYPFSIPGNKLGYPIALNEWLILDTQEILVNKQQSIIPLKSPYPNNQAIYAKLFNKHERVVHTLISGSTLFCYLSYLLFGINTEQEQCKYEYSVYQCQIITIPYRILLMVELPGINLCRNSVQIIKYCKYAHKERYVFCNDL